MEMFNKSRKAGALIAETARVINTLRKGETVCIIAKIEDDYAQKIQRIAKDVFVEDLNFAAICTIGRDSGVKPVFDRFGQFALIKNKGEKPKFSGWEFTLKTI